MSDVTQARQDDHVVLGRVTSPHGVKGWVKVYSYTSPMEGILEHRDWVLCQQGRLRRHRLVQGRRHGKGLVACLEDVYTREGAEALANAEILFPKADLPALAAIDYYWYQLEGLKVVTRDGVVLGSIAYLFETGANDVIVVKGDGDQSVDDRERLLPFLPDEVIVEVDLDAGVMIVDWDLEF
jgi:16S rRNA processing protein RimM